MINVFLSIRTTITAEEELTLRLLNNVSGSDISYGY